MSERELLPCPFDGGIAVLEEFNVRKGYEALVKCNGGCIAEVRTITYETPEEAREKAIEVWNRRAPNGSRKLEEALEKIVNAKGLDNTILAIMDGKHLLEAIRNEQEAERDFTPEEAQEEAMKRWGDDAWAEKIEKPYFKFVLCKVGAKTGHPESGMEGIPYFEDSTFRAAFAAADKESER